MMLYTFHGYGRFGRAISKLTALGGGKDLTKLSINHVDMIVHNNPKGVYYVDEPSERDLSALRQMHPHATLVITRESCISATVGAVI